MATGTELSCGMVQQIGHGTGWSGTAMQLRPVEFTPTVSPPLPLRWTWQPGAARSYAPRREVPAAVRAARTELLGDPLRGGVSKRLGSSRLRFGETGSMEVRSAAFSPDGKTLAVGVGGVKGTVLLLDAETGKEIRRI